MKAVSLSYHLWWSKEFSRPMVPAHQLIRLTGADEYTVDTSLGMRVVCKIMCLPKKKTDKPVERLCDVITGAVFSEGDPRVLGIPKRTGRKVPRPVARNKEAASRVSKPLVITGVTA